MPISSEITDEKILSLLGLEDRFDIPADEYYQLLQERIQRSAFGADKLSAEELALLSNEKKRIREKKDTKEKFKVKKTKITAEGLGIKRPEQVAQKALPPAKGSSFLALRKEQLPKEVSEKPVEFDPFKNSLLAINESLDSILKTLTAQNKIKEKTIEANRKKTERDKRSLAESNLEKRFAGLRKVAEKILAPVKSILDRITEFLVNVILGRVVYKLIEWLGDPSNASKVKSIIRFVKDWWPALLGAYVLFGTTFGKFIRGTVGLVGRFIFQIGKIAIPKLLKFIKSPLGIGAALFTAGATVPALFPQTVDEQERKTKSKPGSTEDKIKALQQQKANLNFFEKLQGKGSEIDEQITYLQTGKTKSYGFSGGGLANGYVSGEKGVDKVPAMLSDGEFVMSRGAVQTWGLDTLESMNAAGGGTNRPRIVQGTTFAAGGGSIGQIGDARKGLIDVYNWFNTQGVNLQDTRTWSGTGGRFATGVMGGLQKGVNQFGMGQLNRTNNYPKTQSKISTGSLITDPVGAVARIANNMGIKTPNVPSSRMKLPGLPSGMKLPTMPSGLPSGIKLPTMPSGMPGPVQEVIDKLKGPGSETYRNAGNIYAKQMLGGFGGPISERDLAPQSQAELQKAIQRAKKRTSSEISKAEAKIKELRAQGAKDGNPALETQKSFLKKLKAGGIRVQYTDYADEKGNVSESAKNAKNILGQFWANERSKEEGGGYRIEDKYDFDMMKIKDAKTGKMRDMTGGELLSQGVFGKGKTTQQRLQAAYLLNPFRGKGDVDMVLGGKRTAAENAGLAASKTLLGGMLGASGKPKDKNTQALEAKRPWWDKLGMFGGASAQIKKDQEFLKKNPGVTLYNKSKPKAQVAKTKPKSATVAQSTKPKPKVTVVKSTTKPKYQGGQRSGKTKTPNFSAVNSSASSAKAKTLGVTR